MTTSAPAHTAPLGGGGRPLWLSALAVLLLHAGLALAWWLAPNDATHLAVTTPMTVRLTEVSPVAHAPQSAARPQRTMVPAPQAARPEPAAARGGARVAAATAAQVPQAPQSPQAAPVPVPATRAPTALPVAAPSPVSPVAPAPVSAHAAPVADAPHPTPTPAPSPSTAPAPSGLGANSQAVNLTTQATVAAGGEGKGPVDMPSASISYLVQPVLTFPPGSEDLGESGSVTLRVLVDEKGVPIKVERVKSSGYPRLDQHAVSVIRRARFVPHQVQGESRAAWATVTLNFNLH